MSRTSSEPSTTRFRRGVLAAVVTLVVLCSGFAVVGSLQGPKLESARIDTALAVAQPGQALQLTANQALAQIEPDQVTIAPETPFTVDATDSIVTVRFESALRYDTQYRVTVDGVTNPYRDQPGSFDYTFATGSATVTYLDRGDPTDRVVRAGLSGGDEQVLFESAGIQSFAVIGQALAVVLEPVNGASALQLVLPGDARVARVNLPEAGIVSDLRSVPELGIIGFRFTSASAIGERTYQDTLFWLDATGGIDPAPVLGIDGTPLRVADWRFLGGIGKRILALSDQRSLLLVDLGGLPPTPFGQFTDLLGVSVDGTTATMSDGPGPVIVDLVTGTTTRYALPPLGEAVPFLSKLVALQNGRTVASGVAFLNGEYGSIVMLDDGTGTGTRLYPESDDIDGGTIQGFSVSANEQYVAVQVVRDAVNDQSDQYEVEPQYAGVLTVVIDLEVGKRVAAIPGFALVW